MDKEDVGYKYIHMYMYIYIYIYIHTHKHTMVFDSATDKNEILPFATIWIDLDGIMVK